MKIVLFVCTLVFSSWTVFGAATESAYNALRLIGKQSGTEPLNHVVEVRGRGGSPVPAVWKIVLEDSRARGGIRELDIQKGKTIGERTPTKRALGAPMNFNQLNLDSEGAFSIANQQAEKAGIPFDRVDYVLRSGAAGAAPVWELQLMNTGQGPVGSVQIAADTGAILKEDFPVGVVNRSERSRRTQVTEDQEFVRGSGRGESGPSGGPRRYTEREEEDRDRDRDRENDRVRERGEPIHDVPSLFRRAEHHFERRGVQIKRFFTGE